MGKKNKHGLESLLNRLDVLDRDLTPDLSGKASADDGLEQLDEFGRMKRACARMAQDIRKDISERDELMGSGGGNSRRTIELSAKVRKDLKVLKDTAEQLGEMQRREAARLDKKPLIQRKSDESKASEVEHHSEVVDLVWRHIEEIELLEKRRHQTAHSKGPQVSDRAGLLSTNTRVAALPASALDTQLGSIDAETQEGLAMLQRKDQEIDADLELLSQGVKRLHVIASDMKDEVEMQNMMVEEITTQVDKNIAHLQNLNAKVKDTLEKAGGIQRMVVTLILFILLLAVAAYAIKLFIGM